jgi:hypothetical protein
MSTPTRRESLEQLRREIANTQPLNDATRERLARLDRAIAEEHETLGEQLEEDAVHFEADHPTLTAAIRAAINILSNSGV